MTDPNKTLDFYQAMGDFKSMFPGMDEEIIEAVLRANNGAVDATIDQLLSMSMSKEELELGLHVGGQPHKKVSVLLMMINQGFPEKALILFP
jgi:hypothetical protein